MAQTSQIKLDNLGKTLMCIKQWLPPVRLDLFVHHFTFLEIIYLNPKEHD